MVQQEQHLHLGHVPPQALVHAKAKGQVREPASRALAVQPALGVKHAQQTRLHPEGTALSILDFR